ncbi:MAG: 2-amino-4-hydroxy-6-hydroxymethyldihydropteridine diphosphokinase [Pseudomonadota bacterium]
MNATRVYLSLGSNLEPERHLRLGVQELMRRYPNVVLSPVYRNAAVGFDGADFLNLAVRCEVAGTLEQLLADLETIHSLAGRTRGEQRFADRTLDIDVLMYGEMIDDTPIELPRPDLLKYSFVLKPMCDIAPDEVHPVTGRALADHWVEWPSGDAGLEPVDLDLER